MNILPQGSSLEHQSRSPCFVPLNKRGNALSKSAHIQRTAIVNGDRLVVYRLGPRQLGVKPDLLLARGRGRRARIRARGNGGADADTASPTSIQPRLDKISIFRR